MNVVHEGVYFLYDGREIVYVGESDNLFRRIGQHIADGSKKFDRFEIYPTAERKTLEGFLIRALKPKYNLALGTDGLWYNDDLFPTMTALEAVQKYEERNKDRRVKQVAEEIGVDAGWLLRTLVQMNAPVYKVDGSWRIDRMYLEEQKELIYKNI